MRPRDLEGFGPVGTNGPTIADAIDLMRDVYMTPSQRAAYDRIAELARKVEGAERGVRNLTPTGFIVTPAVTVLTGRPIFGDLVALVPIGAGE